MAGFSKVSTGGKNLPVCARGKSGEVSTNSIDFTDEKKRAEVAGATEKDRSLVVCVHSFSRPILNPPGS